VQIVVLSLRRDVQQAALAAGAHRFISKSAAPAEVLAALASLYGGTK
jgi:DNA-binding NarL/FixJ family response regulator